ncbi:MAG: hypothetical protein ACOYOS_23610, partial [Syntrophales bacterium]
QPKISFAVDQAKAARAGLSTDRRSASLFRVFPKETAPDGRADGGNFQGLSADQDAQQYNQVRIIDESGESYPYPNDFFAAIRLPVQTRSRIVKKAA